MEDAKYGRPLVRTRLPSARAGAAARIRAVHRQPELAR